MASANMNLARRVIKVRPADLPRQPFPEGLVWRHEGQEAEHREKLRVYDEQMNAALSPLLAAPAAT